MVWNQQWNNIKNVKDRHIWFTNNVLAATSTNRKRTNILQMRMF